MEELRNNVCEVTFTKVNADTRIMTCTLMESYIPVRERAEEKRKVSKSSNTISVWSINDNAWRSFRKDSVISLNILI